MRIHHVVFALALLAAGAAEAQQRGEAPLANRAQIEQRGGPHRAAAAQFGASNFVAVAQQGRGNTATATQAGDANVAVIRQHGQNITGSIAQSGSNNTACLFQVGRNIGAGIVQTGGQNTGVIQTPGGIREVPVAICNGARLGRGGVIVGADPPRTGRGRQG